MSEHVLVSPLGLSPGAVSGLVLALRHDRAFRYHVTRVITVGTSHPDVLASARCLKNLFHELEDVQYEAWHISAAELRASGGAADTFVTQIGAALQTAVAPHNTVHVGVTGGRAGMGALAALATNLYGADHLWHLWVTEEIETGGRKAEMQQPVSLDNRYLNPTVEEGSYELVELPVVDLRPLQPLLFHYAETGDYPDPASPFYNLFISGQVNHLKNVFPESLTISQVERLMVMAGDYKTADADGQEELLDELSTMLHAAGVVDNASKKKLRLLVKNGATPAQIVQLLVDSSPSRGFGGWLKSAVKNNLPAITAATSILDLLAELGKLYLAWRAGNP